MAGKKSWRRAMGMLIASVAGSLLLVTPGMVEAQSGTVVGTVLDTELKAKLIPFNELFEERYHQLTGLATTEEILNRQMELFNAEMDEFNSELVQVNPSLDHLKHLATDWQAVAADGRRMAEEWRESQDCRARKR